MEMYWYIVVFLTFWSRHVQTAPLAAYCPMKLYAPCNIVQQSDNADSKAPIPNAWPEIDAIGRVSSKSVECGAGIRCPCSILEKASQDLEHDVDHHHTDEKRVICDNAIPESKDEQGAGRYYCSCAPVFNSAECYSLAMPVLVMLALGLAVHSTLKSAREHSTEKTNMKAESNYAKLSVSSSEKSEKGTMVAPDAQDQDVESFDDSNFPMG